MKFVLMVNLLIHICTGNIHSWGDRGPLATYRFYERILIDDKNDVPMNYTIIHKHFGSYYKTVAYVEINVNAISNGYIHQSNGPGGSLSFGRGTETIQIFDAKVYINDVRNVTATLSIYAFGSPLYSTALGEVFKQQRATKSITYIYVKNASPALEMQSFAQNSIGHRRQGDQLIHFESRNVRNVNQFPSKLFEYSGRKTNEYITYVGFSFNSPTAMVLINTSYIGEQEFNAVAYDVNNEHFVANMSVYGIKSGIRPQDFLGVI